MIGHQFFYSSILEVSAKQTVSSTTLNSPQEDSMERSMPKGTAAGFAFLCGISLICPAWAFNTCKVQEVDPRPSQLPMDASDPVSVGSNIYMAYTTASQLVFLASTDGGLTFTNQRLDDGREKNPIRPRIAAYGSNVYIAWQTDESGGQLIFRESTNSGATFGPRTSLGQAYKPAPITPQIAASALGVTVIFVDGARGTTLVSSADGGKTWPNTQVLTIPGLLSSEVWVGRLGQQIVGAWSEVNFSGGAGDRFTYVGASADGGAHYAVSELTTIPSGAREREVAVSTTTGFWYIYALDFGSPGPGQGPALGVLWTSKDGGLSWARQVLSTNSNFGVLLVSGSTLYVTWQQDLRDGTKHVELTYSLNNGQTWAAPNDLSGPTGYPNPQPENVYLPGISVSGQAFSEVYESQGNVMVRSTADITKGLSKPINLGTGTNAQIAGGSVLWLGPGQKGENQAVFYAHCQ
jgi:hypothetical protein